MRSAGNALIMQRGTDERGNVADIDATDVSRTNGEPEVVTVFDFSGTMPSIVWVNALGRTNTASIPVFRIAI